MAERLAEITAGAHTVLENERGNLYIGGRRQHVVLTTELFAFRPLARDAVTCVQVADMVGAMIREKDADKGDPRRAKIFLDVYSYPQGAAGGCCGGSLVRTAMVFSFLVRAGDNGDDVDAARELAADWKNAILAVAHGHEPQTNEHGQVVAPPAKRTVVIVNPNSGDGKSARICANTVQPMMLQAGVEFTVLETTHANHAREFIGNLDMDNSPLDFITTIGGDGIIFEVVQGLYDRGQDWISRMPLAIIPGGSGNGLAISIAYESGEAMKNDPVDATFIAIKGHSTPIDLAIVQAGSTTCLSFLNVEWGLVSDVDLNSEHLRWMGGLRFDVYAAYKLMIKPSWRGKIYFHPVPGSDLSGHVGAADEFKATEEPGNGNQQRPLLGDPHEMPGLAEPVPEGDGWMSAEGDFSVIWGFTSPYASLDYYGGRGLRLNDGATRLVYVLDNEVTRPMLINFFLKMADGPVGFEGVHVYDVDRYRLEPESEGKLAVDGEEVEYGPIQSRMWPGAGRVMSLAHPGEGDEEGGRV